MKSSKMFMAGLCVLPFLTGCSNTEIGRADRAALNSRDYAADSLYRGQLPLKPDTSNVDEVSDGVWTGGKAIRSDHGAPLPYQWETSGVTLQKPQMALSLRQISQKITQATGIPIVFAADVQGNSQNSQQAPVAQPSSATQAPPGRQNNLSNAIQSLNLAQNVGNSNDNGGDNYGEVEGDEQKMVLTFKSGPLSALLNEISAYYGITWKYDAADNGKILFYRNVTRIFHINALPIASMNMNTGMTQDLNSSAGSGSGQSSNTTSGTNNQNTTTDISVKIWDDIEGSIRTIIQASGSGGWLSASRSTGTLSVTAPAQVMDKIQNFIDTQNAILSKQVNISVQVLSVQMTESDALSVDMKALIGSAMSLGSPATGALSAASDAGSQIFNYTVNGGKANGTSFLIQELSKIGHVEVTTNTDIMTLNGVPAPLQVAHTQGYVAQVQTMVTSTSSSSASNSQTTLTPGSVTYGFNMMILPEVMPGNDMVLLHFGSSLSDLNGSDNGFDVFSSGNQTVQLVNVISRNFQQEAMVPNGKSVVISGFQQTNAIANKQGTGTASFLGLGGSQSGQRTKTMIVIILTPVVLSRNAITYSDMM